ncbi:Stp1/IreP family PP2C-type Ser/Thr phosphatase [uncultured Oscillibacter sp.]|uniref:Stp1/IreP family PP2C-type Ser/Thr phosphatase n=1 Tax=uncultured Oscillibacter sp. TaxID=876091 RepID=UPI0025CD4239|nr:Stp1/IreP family PP2C-type Ser/Thr phosphatase [uncultured Oscillibacter sp.]
MTNIWSITDTGLVRKENQDAFAVMEAFGHTICVVCDGMGGSAGGKLASRIAVDTFSAEMEKRLSAGTKPDRLREISVVAVALANRAVREAARSSVDYRNMGTTLVSAVSFDGGVVIANVGDSRAYHITKDRIVQVTRDHSLVEHMVERGDITAEEARRHPNRNLITRALGPDVDPECDCYTCQLAPGDFLLLCTDGLVNTVTDQEILTEVLREDTETCMDRLLNLSKSRGASDNVTVVLARNL